MSTGNFNQSSTNQIHEMRRQTEYRNMTLVEIIASYKDTI